MIGSVNIYFSINVFVSSFKVMKKIILATCFCKSNKTCKVLYSCQLTSLLILISKNSNSSCTEYINADSNDN